MPKYKHILALDPSGNFDEGKGTTGWVLMNYKEKLIASGAISANDYRSKEEYYEAILELIDKNHIKYRTGGFILVMEEYVLYRDKAVTQTNSKMETCRLLGIIQQHCWRCDIDYTMQLASMVKHRWSDELLLREGIFYSDNRGIRHTESNYWMNTLHVRDAFRHAIHYCLCRNETPKKPEYKKHQVFSNYVGGENVRSECKSGQRETETYSGTDGTYKSRRYNTRVWRP